MRSLPKRRFRSYVRSPAVLTISHRYDKGLLDQTALVGQDVRNAAGHSVRMVVAVEVSRLIYNREVRQWNH